MLVINCLIKSVKLKFCEIYDEKNREKNEKYKKNTRLFVYDINGYKYKTRGIGSI